MYHVKTSDENLQLHPWGIACLVMEPEEKAAYPQRNDLLWKGILEEVFEDFLRFFYPNADAIFNLKRAPEYLDKELEQLFEPEEEQFAPRHVDKLIKVFTRKGKERWILLHCEVQGYRQKEFPERMFRYFSRIWDKYQRRVKALAILTDEDKNFRPAVYQQRDEDDEDNYLDYGYKIYKVLDQSEAELEKSDNPFAMVLLTTKAALKGSKEGFTQEQLYKAKLDLARRLHQKQIPEKKKRALMNFLRYYLRFQKEAMNVKFENELNKITGRTTTMGIEELLLAQARHEGEAKGKSIGEAIGEAKMKKKEISFVQTLIKDTDFDNQKIAALAGVEETFVKSIRLIEKQQIHG